MDFGVVLQTDPPASGVVETMRRAEGEGFRYGWTFDSHVLWQDTVRHLLADPRGHLGHDGRADGDQPGHPALEGHRALFATLNDMFGNRTVCGLGRGDSARRVIGQNPVTLATMSEAMHVIKELAEGREVTLDGAPIRIPWVRDGKLEIWMAAYGPKALALVGQQADGFILQTADPDIARWTVGSVRAAARAAGRIRTTSTICVAAPAYIGTDVAHRAGPAALVRRDGRQPRRRPGRPVRRGRPGAARADRLHQGPGGIRLRPSRAGREPVHGLRARCHRGPVLPARAGRGAPRAAARAGRDRRGPVRPVPDARPARRDARRLRPGDHPRSELTLPPAPIARQRGL